MYMVLTEDFLLSGYSGFFGKIISEKLIDDGYKITGLQDSYNNKIDITKPFSLSGRVYFNIVIHSAGKAHSVPKTEIEKQEFFNINVKGTENLLKGLEQSLSLPKSFVFISSVAVYGVEIGNNINEAHPLEAKDPYGLSKIQAEQLVQEWCAKNNITCGILRLPLLVGKNPPGNLGTMIKGIKKGYYFNIASGKAKKSMVMAEDVAKIILKVAKVGGIYNLTDGYHPSFSELSNKISKQLKKGKILNMPLIFAKAFAKVGDLINGFPINSSKLVKITSDLTFDDTKARTILGWNPSKVLDKFEI